MSEEKIKELETMIMHQAKDINDLSDMVNKQWQEIEALKTVIRKTNSRLKNIEDLSKYNNAEGIKSLSDLLAEEKPPHY